MRRVTSIVLYKNKRLFAGFAVAFMEIVEKDEHGSDAARDRINACL